MLDYTLSADQLDVLRAAHRSTGDKREADRLKAVIALASGWTAEAVAEILQIDANTVRNNFKRYRESELSGLCQIGAEAGGSTCALTEEQLAFLDIHLQNHLYPSAKVIVQWVKETFGVSYTESGMIALLHRLGFVYKRPKLVPGKPDPVAQREFLDDYEKLKETKGKDDPIYFMDAVHPQHNPVLASGWIKRGKRHEVPSNTGRRRVNINGAI